MDFQVKNYLSDEYIIVYKRGIRKKIRSTVYASLHELLVESISNKSDNFYHDICVDLKENVYHSLFFNINVDYSNKNTTDLVFRFFDLFFLPVLKQNLRLNEFTAILAIRNDRRGGLHVYIPGFAIAHDDYRHLSSKMSDFIDTEKELNVWVDYPLDWGCVGCTFYKPYTIDLVYMPVRVIHVKGDTYETLNFEKKCPSNSFQKIQNGMFREAIMMMSPIPEKDWTVLYYPTKIVPDETNFEFTSFLNEGQYSIIKCDNLEQSPGQTNGSFLYQFFKNHADSIQVVQSDIWMVHRFMQRFLSHYVDEGLFGNVNSRLRNQCVHLRHETNPLKSIFMSSEFVLPVFYALCHEIDSTKETIAKALMELHEPAKKILEYPGIMDIKLPHPLTIETILYCAYRTLTQQGCFWEYIGMGWDWIFESTTTVEEMKKHVKFVQKTHYPMILGNEGALYWDPHIDAWQSISEQCMVDVYQDIYRQLKLFDGFSKVPSMLKTDLDNNTDWLNEIANETLGKLCRIEIDTMTITYEKFSKMYGTNVPEYQIFKLNRTGQEDV